MNEDDEVEAVLGYLFTHADCPHCSDDNAYEGDRSGETVTCTACGKDFDIREVM